MDTRMKRLIKKRDSHKQEICRYLESIGKSPTTDDVETVIATGYRHFGIKSKSSGPSLQSQTARLGIIVGRIRHGRKAQPRRSTTQERLAALEDEIADIKRKLGWIDG